MQACDLCRKNTQELSVETESRSKDAEKYFTAYFTMFSGFDSSKNPNPTRPDFFFFFC